MPEPWNSSLWVEAGIQYFIPEILDAADEETIRLLAEQVVPHIRPGR